MGLDAGFLDVDQPEILQLPKEILENQQQLGVKSLASCWKLLEAAGRAFGIGTPAVLSRNLGEALAQQHAVYTLVNAQELPKNQQPSTGAPWSSDVRNPWAQVAEGNRGELSAGQERLLYVHIGKCGGSALGCRLKNTYENPSYYCMDHETLDRAALNSTLSQKTTERIHFAQRDMEPIDYKWTRLAHGFSSFLVIVRNPMTRVISEFYYSQAFTEEKQMPTMKKMHECYKTVGELAEGIAGGWHSEDSPQLARQDPCSAVAMELVSGRTQERSHFRFNFEFFAQKVLQVWPRDVFILRNEHLWDDYSHLDSLLGGRGVRPLDIHIRSDSDTNRTMSSSGRAAFCQLLCRELYYYKVFLLESKNLDSTELQKSWDDLELECPGSSKAPPMMNATELLDDLCELSMARTVARLLSNTPYRSSAGEAAPEAGGPTGEVPWKCRGTTGCSMVANEW
eukprot:Skav232730  [mRNA]  locus=scaffold1843:98848:111191:- [translate_table: standard]